MRALRTLLKTLLLAVLIQPVLAVGAEASFWSSYPRDGHFKQLPARGDMWFYVDNEHWAIRAPDKWQHYAGCYVFQKLVQKKLGRLKAFLLTETLGVLKEWDDGYREGWSPRDLIADNLGILTALVASRRLKFVGSFDSEKFLVTAHLVF